MQEKHMQVAYRCPFCVHPPLQAGKAEAPAVQGCSQAPARDQDLRTAQIWEGRVTFGSGFRQDREVQLM